MTLVAALLAAAPAAGIVIIVSNAIDHNDLVVATLTTAKARSITITSTNPDQQPLLTGPIEAIARLPAIDAAVVLSRPTSLHNPPLDSADASVALFTLRTLTGPTPYSISGGRQPRPGEVVLSAGAGRRLGINTPETDRVSTDTGIMPTVGRYTTSGLGSISDLLTNTAITPSSTGATDDAAILVVVVHAPADIAPVVATTIRLLGTLPPASYQLAYDQRAASIEHTIRSEGRRDIRTTTIALIALGAITIGLSSFINTLARRRDMARQRALGRTRLEISATVIIHAATIAVIGATAGAVAATAWLDLHHVTYSPRLIVAAIIVNVTAQSLAAIPGAAFAAVQDPASILRVP